MYKLDLLALTMDSQVVCREELEAVEDSSIEDPISLKLNTEEEEEQEEEEEEEEEDIVFSTTVFLLVLYVHLDRRKCSSSFLK